MASCRARATDSTPTTRSSAGQSPNRRSRLEEGPASGARHGPNLDNGFAFDRAVDVRIHPARIFVSNVGRKLSAIDRQDEKVVPQTAEVAIGGRGDFVCAIRTV